MPRVVTSAVRAPLPSSSALVTTVVACASHATSAGRHAAARVAAASASSTPRAKSRGVVGTLTTPMPPARLVDEHDVGEGAADVDADAPAHAFAPAAVDRVGATPVIRANRAAARRP